MKMKAILRKNNCLAAIGERPMMITDDKWNEIDGSAISDLHLALTDGVLSSVAEKNTAKEIWDTLTKLYEAKSLHNKIFLKRKLYTLRMAESIMVTDHINTLKTLYSQLTTLGHNIEENERAELLLQSLPDSQKNKENRQASSQQAEVLSVTRGRSTERGPSGSQNHGRSKSKSKKNVKCYNCGKKGHIKKECRSNQKRREGKEPESSNAQGCVASTSDDGEILYSKATTVSEGRKQLSDVWLIDSGATWHMTSQREWFHTHEPISGGSVYMGNDHALEIAGIGTIKIKMFDGTIRTIGEKQPKTACYIVNRSSFTAIGLKTAMAMWIGKPTDYSYLHAFGCPVYVMYNAQERTKLDPKSRRRIFLGYADGVKGHRLWDPTAHKIVISKDFIFIEDQLQRRDEDDSTVNEKLKTMPIYVENNLEDSDSSEAAPEHEEQEPVESEALEVRRSTHERRLPAWHSSILQRSTLRTVF
ncbi:hypothetical protein KPL71_017199 [Citrus sinensis]|uniref:Uncharacterized protein n=1 Tax=Citrus sinensis TaxID=2711 RepID=A0ACB8JQ55_CITSI|nr:hypothetical protein KPL71_017199 [Citrus sinensis]